MRFNVILAMPAPAAVVTGPGIGRWVWHLSPRIVRRSAAVLQFVINEVLKEGESPRVSGVWIETFHKTLQHGSQISSRVGPGLVGDQLVGRAIKIEATVKIIKSLAVVLIQQDGPLRKKGGREGIADIVGHRPGQKFSSLIQFNRPPCDGGLIDGRDCGKRLGLFLSRGGGCENECERDGGELSTSHHGGSLNYIH